MWNRAEIPESFVLSVPAHLTPERVFGDLKSQSHLAATGDAPPYEPQNDEPEQHGVDAEVAQRECLCDLRRPSLSAFLLLLFIVSNGERTNPIDFGCLCHRINGQMSLRPRLFSCSRPLCREASPRPLTRRVGTLRWAVLVHQSRVRGFGWVWKIGHGMLLESKPEQQSRYAQLQSETHCSDCPTLLTCFHP